MGITFNPLVFTGLQSTGSSGGGGGGANTTLSNLTSPVALNQPLQTALGTNLQLITTNNPSGNSDSIILTPGTASGTRGEVEFFGGDMYLTEAQLSNWWGTTLPGFVFNGNTPTAQIAAGVLFGTADIPVGNTTTSEVDINLISGSQLDPGNVQTTGIIYVVSGNNLGTGIGAASGALIAGSGLTSSPSSSGLVYIASGGNSSTGSSGPVTFASGDTTSGSSGTVTINSGATSTSSSGYISITTGAATTASSGPIYLISGATTGSSASGSVTLESGGTVNATSGNIYLQSSASSGSGGSGAINLLTGNTTSGTGSASGEILLLTGDVSNASTSGNILIQTGNPQAASGASGNILITAGQSGSSPFVNTNSGQVIISNANVTGTGNSGSLTTESGSVVDGNSGQINFQTGAASGIGNSGNILFKPGTVNSGTRGKLQFQDGSEGTSGYAWTSIDGSGSGNWQAIVAPAGTLSGTTLNSSVTHSSLTTVGNILTGSWAGSVIAVAHGGTGNSSINAYTVVCGGTTSTNALQHVSGNGTSGQVLSSNGINQLPTWNTLGISATITTAALTVGGTQGSMTFVNGCLTAQTQAT